MTDYFGFDVREEYDGQVGDFISNIDPYYQKALVVGVHLLSQDQGEPVRDHYFTAVYATIMEMEDLFRDKISREYISLDNHYQMLDYSNFEEKN